MPKISTSLVIALAIHISILFILAFLIEKKPSAVFEDTKSSINYHLGTSKVKSNLKKLALAKKSTSHSRVAINTQNEAVSDHSNESGAGVGDTVATFSFGDSVVSFKAPIYPKLAIKRELQGSVRIKVMVSIEGKPMHTEILKSSGFELLDKAALEAVLNWDFQAKRVSYFVEKTIIFKLKN